MADRNSESKPQKSILVFMFVATSSVCLFILLLAFVSFFSSQYDDSEEMSILPQISAPDPGEPVMDPAVKPVDEPWVSLSVKHAQDHIRKCYWWALEQDASVSTELAVKVMFSRAQQIVVWEDVKVTKSPSLFFRPCLMRKIQQSSLIDLSEDNDPKSPIEHIQTKSTKHIMGIVKNGKIHFGMQ